MSATTDQTQAENILSIQEAAGILSVSSKTLRRWEEKGILVPHRSAGGHRRYDKEQVESFKRRLKTKKKKNASDGSGKIVTVPSSLPSLPMSPVETASISASAPSEAQKTDTVMSETAAHAEAPLSPFKINNFGHLPVRQSKMPVNETVTPTTSSKNSTVGEPQKFTQLSAAIFDDENSPTHHSLESIGPPGRAKKSFIISENLPPKRYSSIRGGVRVSGVAIAIALLLQIGLVGAPVFGRYVPFTQVLAQKISGLFGNKYYGSQNVLAENEGGQGKTGGSVLGDNTLLQDVIFKVNVPALFKEAVKFDKNVDISGDASVSGKTNLGQTTVHGPALFNKGITLSGVADTIQTLAQQVLTIGGPTTGAIDLIPSAGGANAVTNNTGSVNLVGNNRAYEINGVPILTGTTLGTGVTTSSLTTVGVLSTGSIGGGFGQINTGNTITGTVINGTTSINSGGGIGTIRIDASGNLINISNITASGNITFSKLSSGIVHSDGSGLLTSTAVGLSSGDVTGILPSKNGGTGADLSAATVGSVPYFSTTGVMSALPPSSSGLCFTTNGTGVAPSWSNCSGLAGNLFNTTNGLIYPQNSTEDFSIGGQSTASAKFAFLNVNSGTPVASVSAGAAGAVYLTADGKLATTTGQSLVLGDSTATGNVIINPAGNVGVGTTAPTSLFSVGASSQFQVNSSGAIAATTGYTQQSGNFAISGTGTFGTGTGAVSLNGNTTVNGTTTLNGNATITGTNTLAITALNTQYGVLYTNGAGGVVGQTGQGPVGTVLHGNDGSGAPSFSAVSLTADVANILPIANGGTNTNAAPVSGGVAYGSGGAYAFSAAGTGGYCLTSGGSGAPVWQNCATASTNVWASTNGAIYPQSSTEDLLLGGQSTASAKFAFINNASGTPTASIAGSVAGNAISINGNGVITTSLNRSLALNPTGGNVGVGTSTPTGLFSVGASSQFQVDPNGVITAPTSSNTINGLIINAGALSGVTGYTQTSGNFAMSGTGTFGTGTGAVSLNGNTTVTGTGTLTVAALNQAGGVIYANGSGQLLNNGTGSSGFCLTSGGSGTPTWSSCSGSAGNQWNSANGTIFPYNSTNDLLIGGQSTASAKFAVVNMNGSGTPTASVSAGANSAGGAFLTATGTLQTTQNQTLTLGGGTTGNIVFSPLGGTGSTTFGGTSTVTISAFNQAGGVVYSSGLGQLGQSITGTSGFCLLSGGSGAPTWANCNGASGSLWASSAGLIYPQNSTLDFAVGGQSTASAKFAVINVNSGTPTASISASSGNNATYLTGDGTLATTNRQTLTLGNSSTYNTTGNILLQPNGTGFVGIGTSTPSQLLEVDGNGYFNAGSLYVGTTTTGLAASNGFQSISHGNQYAESIIHAQGNIASIYANPQVTAQNGYYANSVGFGTKSSAVNTYLGFLGSSAGGGVTINYSFNGGIGGYTNFTFNNVEKMRLDSSGNLGIATTTPTAKLDVAGAASVSGSLSFRQGAGSIQTTTNSDLTIGGNTTGAITLSPLNGAGNLFFKNLTTNTFGLLYTDSTGLVSQTAQGAAHTLLHGNGAGAATFSQIDLTADVTGLLPIANGGTNSNATPTAGGIAYGTGTAYAFNTAGSSGQCLVSGGSGSPTWGGCGNAGAIWLSSNGAMYPANSTEDIFVGGQATTSAKFAFMNVNSGVPTASIAGTLSTSALTMNGDGTIATTMNRALALNPNGGGVGIGTTSPGAKLEVDAAASGIGTIIKDNATTPGDLLQLQNSGGTKIGAITSTGQFVINNSASDAGISGGASMGLGTDVSNNVILRGNANIDLLASGNVVQLNGNSALTFFSGSGTINATNGTATSITQTNPSVGAFTSIIKASSAQAANDLQEWQNNGGVVQALINSNGYFQAQGATLSATYASGLGLVVKGSNGQTGDLTEWQNNSGAVQALINSNGYLNTPGATVSATYGAGNALTVSSNSLTTGNAFNVTSTSTALTTGQLAAFDWSPGSATTATGDLFSLNVGANGTIGNIFNVKNNGSSVFSVGQNQITAALPTQFTAAGDIMAGYDLQFVNPTSSFIKSNAPLYVQAGETFNSSDLTLRTFNSGNIVLDAAGGVTLAQTQNWTLASGTSALNIGSNLLNLDSTNNRIGINVATPIAALDTRLNNSTTVPVASFSGQTTSASMVVDQSGSGDIFTASVSGLPKFTILNSGNVVLANLNTAGGVVYTSSTGQLATSAQGTSNFCLTSGGAGAPTWQTCAAGAAATLWTSGSGAIYPLNSTEDLLVGGQATTSAKFAFMNVNSGVPTASIAGTLSTSALTMNGDGTIATTMNRTLALNPSGGDVGIGTTTPHAILDAYGQVRASNSTTNYTQLYHDGANPYLQFSGGNGLLIGNVNSNWGILVGNNGNVDVGAATATSSKLGVSGNAVIGTDDVSAGYASGANGLLVEGNTGIGVTTVNARLDIADSTITTGNVISATSSAITTGNLLKLGEGGNSAFSGNAIFADIDNTGGGGGSFTGNFEQFNNAGVTKYLIDNAGNASQSGNLTLGNGSVIKPAFGPLTLDYKSGANTWAAGLTVQDTTGNVGIGTANPASILTVAGNSTTNTTFGTTSGTSFRVDTQNGQFNFGNSGYIDGYYSELYLTGTVDNVAGTKRIITASGKNLALDPGAGGYVGVNNNTPKGTFDVKAASATLPVASMSGSTNFASQVIDQSGSGDIFTASVSGATKFVITNAGNVGIGTNIVSSGAKLDLQGGNLNVSGSATISATYAAGNSLNVVGNIVANNSTIVSGALATAPATGTCTSQLNTTTQAVFQNATAPTTSHIFFNSTQSKHARISAVAQCTDGSSLVWQILTLTDAITGNAATNNFTVYNPVASLGTNTAGFFNNIYGINVQSVASTITGGFDVAEQYPTSDPTIAAGDVVSMASVSAGQASATQHADFKGQLVKSAGANDPHLFGVVSSNPGLTLGDNGNGAWRRVALNGRVPVKVSTENSPILVGDALTSSSTPGVAMKATAAGQIIGRAVEDYDPAAAGNSATNGTVMMYIQPGYFDPDIQLHSADLAQFSLEQMIASPSAALNTPIGQYVLQTPAGATLDRVITASNALIANLQVGSLTAKSISTDTLSTNALTIKNVSIDQYIAQVVASMQASSSAQVSSSSAYATLAGVPATMSATLTTAPAPAVSASAASLAQTLTSTASATAIETSFNDIQLSASDSKIIVAAVQADQYVDVRGSAYVGGVLGVQQGIVIGNSGTNGNGLSLTDAGNGTLSILKGLMTMNAQGGVTVNGDLTVNGRLTTTDKDAGGFAVIKQGDTAVNITFARAYATTPVITATADDAALKFGIKNRTITGFTIYLTAPATQDEQISWVALAVGGTAGAQTTSSQGVVLGSSTAPATSSATPVSTPAASPSASPSPTPSPSPTATPTSSTAPSSTSTATLISTSSAQMATSSATLP